MKIKDSLQITSLKKINIYVVWFIKYKFEYYVKGVFYQMYSQLSIDDRSSGWSYKQENKYQIKHTLTGKQTCTVYS